MLIRHQLAEFERAKNKHIKAKDVDTLYDMWAPLATMAHWMHHGDATSFNLMDDGDHCAQLIGLIGSAYVTMLKTLDKEEELKADSIIRELGLVLALTVRWSWDAAEYCMDDLEWIDLVLACAEKGGIDLEASGCGGMSGILKRYKELHPDDVEVPAASGAYPSQWAKKASFPL